MTRTRARLDGTSDKPQPAPTSAIEESARKSGQFLQASATQVGRSFNQQDLLAEPLETLEAIEKDVEEKLRQVRSAQNSKRADDQRADLARLTASVNFGKSAHFLPITETKPEVNSEANSVGDAETADEVGDLGEPSLRVANAVGVTNAAVTTQIANLRLRLRGALESSRCETATLLMILIYGLTVLFDLALEGLSLDVWISVYLVVDALFLSIFMIEIMVRLFVFGPRYCSNILNLVDSTVIIFSFAITLVEVAGVNLGGAGSDGQGEDANDSGGDDIFGGDMLKKLAGYLPLLRAGRLVTVIMRTMRTLEHMAATGGNSLDSNGNAVADDDSFCGSYRKAPGAFNWSPTQQDDHYGLTASVHPDKLEALVADSPDVVRVLTDDFSTVLECVRRLDKDKDGKIVFDELAPLLLSKLKEEQLVGATRALFEILDINQDGFITAGELYAARIGLRRLIDQQAEHHTDFDEIAEVEVGKAAVHKSRFEKGSSQRLQRAISARWSWWTLERWQDSSDHLLELRRTRDANGDGAYSEASTLLWKQLSEHLTTDTYQFQPGVVDILRHIDGSGALLEFRIDQIVRSLADCKREVRPSSHAADECCSFQTDAPPSSLLAAL